MNASSHRFVSSGTTLFVAVAVALSLLGPGSVVAAQDAEANLPPSSRGDYHGEDGVVAGVQEAPAEIPFDMPHPEP